jgi:NAD(P)-dependent dehydrogenase (short-subunit alcohol dehydrogenase family)
MFERYTEKARRVIFFARYEASQFGASAIEAEHILLGVLREDKEITDRFFPRPQGAVESIRKEIEGRTTVREKTSTSVDLPLSNLAKRVLVYAHDESDRMGHTYIGTEHLLLGLLREQATLAAEVLRERGLELEAVRQKIQRSGAAARTSKADDAPDNQNLGPEHEIYRLLRHATSLARRIKSERKAGAPADRPGLEFDPEHPAEGAGAVAAKWTIGLPTRVALVTGAGRGIGRAIAIRLAGAGARVALVARTEGEIEAVADEIAGLGGSAVAIRADVSQAGEVEEAFAHARETLGAVDILVNNAGIARSALTWKTDDTLWRSTIETNLTGTFYCMRAALPSMIGRGWGRVINIASVAGKVGAPYIGAYAASKHGVIGLTRSAALEVATKNITVNAICPGYVDTPMTDSSVETIVIKTAMDKHEARRKLETMSPQNRIMAPEEVAFLTLMLASEEALGINGQAINLDGGGVTG